VCCYKGQKTSKEGYDQSPHLSSSQHTNHIHPRTIAYKIMEPYSTQDNSLDAYKYLGYSYRNRQPVYQPYPSDNVDALNTIYYAYPQINTGSTSFLTRAPSLLPLYTPLFPLPSSLNAQPLSVFQLPLGSPDDLYSYDPLLSSSVSTHYPPAESSASVPVPAMATTETIVSSATPIADPPPNNTQRAKFPCLSCGKMCTSRPQADTCFNNHIGAKPFVCNGTCGQERW
jgi:hypothetical protein